MKDNHLKKKKKNSFHLEAQKKENTFKVIIHQAQSNNKLIIDLDLDQKRNLKDKNRKERKR